ncbi:High-affinity branched-chain amino acid transport system permease protein LivH [subsurface metagenome]
MLLQQIINGIVVGSVYSLTAMGVTLIYSILRVLDIACAGAYALGAYVGLFSYVATGNFVLSFLIGMIAMGIWGILVQKFLYLPLLGKSPLISLIASIGLFIFLGDFIRLWAGPLIRDFPADLKLPFSGIKTENLTIMSVWILVLLITATLLFILWYLITKTKIGLAWRATAQDLETAKAMGINVNVVVAFNFFLGYSFAAAAGIMIGIMYNYIFPTMGDVPAYKMLAIIVLGGLGNPLGAVTAAMLIGLIETLVGGYIGFFLPRDSIAFIVVIIMLLIKPQGLFVRKNI